MAKNVFVIPTTIKVGKELLPFLPLANGSLKPTPECSQEEVAEAVQECRSMARNSRARLEQAYQEHLNDIEQLAQVAAYLDRYEQSTAVRDGGKLRELLWQVDDLG